MHRPGPRIMTGEGREGMTSTENLIRRLHAAYPGPDDGVPDAELLRRAATGADPAAFELLVRRHAALVWRVCRAVAGDRHAAEDAFQAAFLALARKATAVRESVPGWLYRVAAHAALRARHRDALRRSAERRHVRETSAEPDPIAADAARVRHEGL